MSINFVAATDNNFSPAPAAEIFSLISADQTAFPRFFPYSSLTSFKTGLSPNAPAFNMGDPVIRAIAQGIIQAALIGGGASIGAAATRAQILVWQTCAIQLVTAILADAGA
jgi:hypothetical protein